MAPEQWRWRDDFGVLDSNPQQVTIESPTGDLYTVSRPVWQALALSQARVEELEARLAEAVALLDELGANSEPTSDSDLLYWVGAPVSAETFKGLFDAILSWRHRYEVFSNQEQSQEARE